MARIPQLYPGISVPILCAQVCRALCSASQIAELTNGEYNEPEREILYDAYKQLSHGKRLTAKHRMQQFDLAALKDTPDLKIVEDFEMHTNTRGEQYNRSCAASL